MGLNVKISLLVCIGFIVGMVWLVNEVGRPGKSIPETAAAKPRTDRNFRDTFNRGSANSTVGKFRRESPAEVAPSQAPIAVQADSAHTTPVATNGPAVAAIPVTLPPLHWPEPAPVVDPVDEPILDVSPVAVAMAESRRTELAAEPVENNRTIQTSPPDVEIQKVTGPWPPGTKLIAGSADKARPEAPAKYTVKPGDTLSRIAQKIYKNGDAKAVAAIRAANPSLKAHPDRLKAGDQLVIPPLDSPTREAPVVVKAGPQSPKVEKSPAPDRNSRIARTAPKSDEKATMMARTSGKTATKDVTRKAAQAQPRIYTVRANESLASIAKKVLGDERRWRELQKLNNLPSDGKLHAGAKLKLPDDKAKSPVTRANADSGLKSES